MEWMLSEAKNKFSEVMNLAAHEGPQFVCRRKERFVILSEKDYEQLTNGKKMSFIEFLTTGPSLEGVDLTRNPSGMREVKL